MQEHHPQQQKRRSYRQIMLQIETLLRERWRQWRQARTTTAPASSKHTPLIIDAHDHASMLVRWQHWCAWLDAQRREVEQRIASRAAPSTEEEAP
jgi:uncharacterized membrane protein